MVLSLLVTVLALVDSYIHLRLSGALFGGPGGGPPPGGFPSGATGAGGPPPGGPPPGGGVFNQLPVPLDQALLWNGVGYVVLVVLFWLGAALLGRRRWLIDAAMIVYAAATIAGWYYVGMPNPMNLGYLSKAVEVVLMVALLLHMRAVTARTPWRP